MIITTGPIGEEVVKQLTPEEQEMLQAVVGALVQALQSIGSPYLALTVGTNMLMHSILTCYPDKQEALGVVAQVNETLPQLVEALWLAKQQVPTEHVS